MHRGGWPRRARRRKTSFVLLARLRYRNCRRFFFVYICLLYLASWFSREFNQGMEKVLSEGFARVIKVSSSSRVENLRMRWLLSSWQDEFLGYFYEVGQLERS